jgi:methionyl-tRNA synthetase
MPDKNKFYVTTPIYYVTAKPHLGSLYSTLLADVVARYNQLMGKKVYFLTGTDEHGQKIAQAAHVAGKDPQTFVDSLIPAYKKIWADYQIEYSQFIRTTDPLHVAAVQQWIIDMQKKGDIYKSFYSGWYCTPCETFISEEPADKGPSCISCGRDTNFVSEESYFFKLSEYQDKLLKFYEQNPNFIVPKERLNEVISFVKSGLKDLSISRTTVSWGIPFPGDPKHVVYVWADALNNYITGIGWGQKNRAQEFKQWWPADLHILGKDIVRFHAVYWPAFLMAAGLELPKKLLVHGWIKVGEQKMSKSLGNVVDPEYLKQTYGSDAIRYYLLRQIAVTHDSPFSIEDLEQHVTADLANDLGNLLNRMVTLALKNDRKTINPPKKWSTVSSGLRESAIQMIDEVAKALDDYLFHIALARVWKFINEVNSYFHSSEPWKLAKTDTAAFEEILSATAHALQIIGCVLWPIMPEKMQSLLASLGNPLAISGDALQKLRSDAWNKQFTLQEIAPLFQKHEPKKETAVEQTAATTSTDNLISIDDFAKIQLVVGTIKSCDTLEQSDKLYKLQVDFGDKGQRQILSGVRKFFTQEELIGKQAIFVFNLKPRKMLGLESQGMMLLAQDAEGKLVLSTVARTVPAGTILK